MAIKRWDGTQWVQQAANGGTPVGYDYATVATSAGIDTLTYSSQPNRFYTGTTTHTVVLPSTSVVTGQQFIITNNSTGIITINASGGSLVGKLLTGQSSTFTAITNAPTLPANWTILKPYVSKPNANFNGTNVTLTTSTQNLVTFSLELAEASIVAMSAMVQVSVSASANLAYVGFAVSGATTIGFNQAYSSVVGNTNGYFTASPIRYETLNAGTHTIAVQGQTTGAGTWIAVNSYAMAIPVYRIP